MSEKARSALIEWEPVNDHLFCAYFKRKLYITSVIIVYAPALCADHDKFCAELQLPTSLPRCNMVITEKTI
ncbi:unnamed protein product [Dracunculus medinensis]|uniref:Uncharacterized protein n=1 Tax=Dracunculus medinensis TaxID=318479 RepID=A0A0N4U3R3_DRAME|nr:unnamed protein product [Dracunculus medinensis]